MIRCLSLALLSIPVRFLQHVFRIEKKTANRVVIIMLCILVGTAAWYKIRDPWIPVTSVCADDYGTVRGHLRWDLHLIKGEHSEEFHAALKAWFEKLSPKNYYKSQFQIVDGRLFMRQSILTPQDFAISRRAQAPEETLYYLIISIPFDLMKKRRTEFGPDYMLSLRGWNDEILEIPLSEASATNCGVTEKLVLKGGELAGD